MIRKLQMGDYLKKFGEMSVQEREEYHESVGKWLRSDGARLLAITDRPMAQTQSIMAMSVRWAAEDCRAFQEGVRLLTALAEVADTWLPTMLYSKSAWRTVRHIINCLSALPISIPVKEKTVNVGNKKKDVKPMSSDKTHLITTEIVEGDTQLISSRATKEHTNPALESLGSPYRAKRNNFSDTVMPGSNNAGAGGVPVRPKHIDQYVHLLPKDTQERAAQVRNLLRNMEEARENARRLMEAGERGDKVAYWMKAATQMDERVGKIYRELDVEWEKLVKLGRVVVDAFGNASVSNIAAGVTGSEVKVLKLTSGEKHRRRELRKWLIDLRRGNEGKARERRIEQWKVNWKEYLTLEPLELALKDEKIVSAAEHFGIDLKEVK